MNESRQQQLYSIVHSYACTVQNCECDGVWWSCLNFRSLSWWLSVLPSLNVKNACCNGRVCERSQTAIVAMSACTYAYISLFRVGCWCMPVACCPSNVVFGLRKKSPLRQHHDRKWQLGHVLSGFLRSGVRNCSLPLPVLVNDDLLERSAHVGQFYLLFYVVPRVVLHHSVLLSDSRPEDLGCCQDREVRNQREGLWNLIAQRGGKHGIAVYRRWCTLTSLSNTCCPEFR